MGTYDTSGGGAVAPDCLETDLHPLVESVLGLLEAEGLPTETNDQIVELIETALKARSPESGYECETCRDNPMVCASIPGLRHCAKAERT